MRGSPLNKEALVKLYIREHQSAAEIAKQLGCSTNKVHYWLDRLGVKKRSQSDATYVKRNPRGDPFAFKKPLKASDHFLLGLGLGLYWGEGTKRSPTSVRLGNTDPRLIKKFIMFLQKVYGVDRSKFRFGLQIFSDMRPQQALAFWSKEIGFPKSVFQKVVVTPARGIGTYRNKTKHGVLTIYVSNKKLRDALVSQIERL